jgi:N-acetylglucosaminyl-diphospho-decaprenol L-rhamnosyltransferase
MIDIIIVNWNTGKDLNKCLSSLLSFNCDLLKNIIVVDNNSNDKSFDISIISKKIILIQSGSNLGFAKGCNLGAKYSTANFILFLNPDTLVNPVILQCCAEVFANLKPKLGILGVKIIDENGLVSRSCSRFPNMSKMILQIIGIDKFLKNLSIRMSDWDHLSDKVVDQVIGAFFMVPSKLFKDLNGFDENFFMYYEEVDFSLRAKKLGYISYYLSTVSIFHEGGGSSKKVKSSRIFYTSRSRILYAKKHFNYIQYLLIIFFTLFIEPITRILFSFFKFNFSDCSSIFLAYYNLYFHYLKKSKF